MTVHLRTSFVVAAVAGLLAASGCGSSSHLKTNLKVTPVKGTITQGGKPLADASVGLLFEGQAPKGYLGAGAKTDAQGNFEVLTGYQKGAPEGTYNVTVSKVVGKDGKPFVNDPEKGMDAAQAMASGETKELIPPAYSDPAQSVIPKLVIKDGTPVPDLKIDIP